MAVIKVRQRKDGKARGVRVRTKGAHASVKISRAKAVHKKRQRKKARP